MEELGMILIMCFFIFLGVTQQYWQCSESGMFHAGSYQ
jgi:hypothetical protein